MNHNNHIQTQALPAMTNPSLVDRLNDTFSQSGFMPHGHCYLWKPLLISLHVVSDTLIGLAYLSISLTLYVLVKRINIGFNRVVWCFGIFIGACGLTHFMEVWNLWHADYWLSAWVKIITAIASVGTGIYLFQLRHAIVQVAEAAKLAEERRIDLETLTSELESRVHIRTQELRASENLLRESEEQFRTLANSIPQLAWIADKNGNVYWFNRRWYEYTNTTSIDVVGWGWERVVHPDDIDNVVRLWQATLKDVKRNQYDVRIKNDKGDFRWFLVQIEPLKNSRGEVTKWFGTNTDIHEQKMFNHMLQMSIKERDEFISIASHEMKTPLTSMKLQVDMAFASLKKNNFESTDPERLRKMFEVTDRQIERMTRLVDDMLDASRVSVGKLSMTLENVNLNLLIHQVIERLAPQLDASQNTVDFKADEEVIGYWDHFRLEQVLTNLLLNSIKYAAGSQIEVKLQRVGLFARVSVKDYGMGIPKERQSRIFNRFERAVSANNISGLGLGLYITKEILNRHGGRIWVESEPGKGATFIFELPL